MTSELRIVRFKLGEVETALRRLAPRIDLEIPGGEFVSAVSGSERETPSTSFILSGGNNAFTVKNGELAASLILHCKDGGIPLPRAGKKNIFVSAKFSELRIGMRHETISSDNGLNLSTGRKAGISIIHFQQNSLSGQKQWSAAPGR